MPTSQGPPQVHPVKNSSHIPEGETHTGLVGTDGRPLSNEHSGQQHQQGDRELSGLGQQQGEQYTARDEGLEPYSAPDTANQSATGNHGSSGYLPEKKIGPAAGAAEHSGQHDNANTGLTGNNADSSNNKQSILADPTHPDNVLVEELERRAQKSGTHAVGFGTHGDEEPPHAQEHGYDPNPAHILGNDSSNVNNKDGNHHGGALAAGGLGAGGLAAGGYSRNTRNSFDNEGDHTDNEAPDMQPSQSYIQRQSLYSQPASTRHGDNNDLPLEQQKTGQSYGQQAPFSSRDYGQGHQGHLVPAGGGVIDPVAGVLPEDAEGGLLAGNYEPSHYTQAGMAGVGAGSAGALGAGALANRSSGASAVGTGALNDGEYAQHPYDKQQEQQHLQPHAQNMEAYPSQQTQRTQQTQQTQQSYGTAPIHNQEQSRDLHDEQQSARHMQGVQDEQPQHHQQYIAAAPVPVPQPIFPPHHQQGESRLQEELPGHSQQNQPFQQQSFQQHQEQPFQQQQEQPFQQESQQLNGPTTAVPVITTAPKAQSTRDSQYPGSPSSTTAAHPIAGGGLAAAIATSGHLPTKNDKKSLKKEIKSERKFEKSLQEEAKKEAEEIEIAMKMAKLSLKKADKSGRYEANFRSTYEKAIKKEIAAKQRLLKVTNEYNKVAADLERVNKEMEIRRNAHIADIQTRDSDSNKVDELRRIKGQHDMEREARHGDSLTKQKQAKRALSMSSKRKSSLF